MYEVYSGGMSPLPDRNVCDGQGRGCGCDLLSWQRAGGPGRDVPRLNVIRVEGVYKANAHACDLPSRPRASNCERFAVVQQAFGS